VQSILHTKAIKNKSGIYLQCLQFRGK